jgi:hypothetical protein
MLQDINHIIENMNRPSLPSSIVMPLKDNQMLKTMEDEQEQVRAQNLDILGSPEGKSAVTQLQKCI